jgi:hypothetical protein
MGKRSGQSGNWPKVFVKARKTSEKVGWSWEYKGSGHWTVRNPDGEFVASLPSTMYDGTLTRKLLATLRRAGCPGT